MYNMAIIPDTAVWNNGKLLRGSILRVLIARRNFFSFSFDSFLFIVSIGENEC